MTSRLFVWATIVVLVSVAGIKGSQAGLLSPVEGIALRPLAPLQGLLHDVAQPLADFVTNIHRYDDIRAENQRLRTENERLRSENAQLQEAQHDVAELQDLLQLKQEYPDDQVVAARVIGYSPNRLQQIITIDQGSDAGLKEGMVVVGKGRSLVGRVTEVHAGYAFVRLITDHQSSVSAIVQGSRVDGVVNGSADGTLSLDFVPPGTNVAVNAAVVTSSRGGNYPDALYIGRVSQVNADPAREFQEIRVEAALDFSSLDFVLILTGFEPRPLGGG